MSYSGVRLRRIMFSLKGGYYGKKGYFQDDSEGAKEDKVRVMDVVVEERIDGSTTSCRHGMMLITHKDRISKYKEINKPRLRFSFSDGEPTRAKEACSEQSESKGSQKEKERLLIMNNHCCPK